MKKISLMIAALGATLAFTACQDSADDHPTIGTTNGQVVDFLNVPEGLAEPVQFTKENIDDNFHMTCSMPKEYGFQAPVSYKVEVSLSEDFQTPMVEGCPASVVLPTAYQDISAINPPYKEVSNAICNILAVEKPDQVPTPYHKMYVRLIANVVTAAGQPYENTTLLSNTVTFDKVSVGYIAVVVAGEPSGIFIRGDVNGWGSPADWEFLTTSVAGVYEIDDATIPAGAGFKVADPNWGPVNYGLGSEPMVIGTPVALEKNGADITLSEDFRGTITIDTNDGGCSILLSPFEPDIPGMPTGVFVRGDFNGWSADAADEFLTTDVKGRWEIANITITPGTFKVADANWGSYNFGGEGELKYGVPYELVFNGPNIQMSDTFVGSAKFIAKGGMYYLKLTPDD